ncbi:MAG: hypothetical protein GWN85_26255, partial [Gemmatimonadetes bacterium]|nr:hypothetical protein [Gemmatimonadota bacterium]NIX22753.1 hypothetical protein [Actinomycetota bacterium]
MPVDGITLGVHGRWRANDESNTVFAEPDNAIVHILEGYAEPVRRVFGTNQLTFFRRMERDSWLVGLSG